MPGITVVIPAFNEASGVGDTVRAASGLPGVDLVLVVDDGSSDGTRAAAEGAGAAVLRHDRNRGKGAALETGAEAARLLGHTGPLLFLDADLGATAANAGPLITPVTSGAADMTIAVFSTLVKLGGHGIVVRTARSGIRRATGWTPQQPLNGQRCLSRAAFDAARPLARGFGVETGLSIDLLRSGMRVVEVEVDMAHRATGTDLAAQLHRARQLADVGLALAPRLLAPRHLARPATPPPACLLLSVIGIFLYVNSPVLSVTGLLLGALGISFGVVAYLRSSRTVHQCRALVQGSVGSRGTVDPRALRDVAIVRYDALNEMSGQLSFSLALLNAVGDGVVVSSINGRAETRTYAKVVLAGKGSQALSPEEEHAVRQARHGRPPSPSPNGDRSATARGALPDMR